MPARRTPRSAAASATGGGRCQYVLPIIPRRPDVSRVYALSCLILPTGALFLCDTHMVVDPTAEQIAEMTLLAAEAVRRLRHRAQGGAAVALQLRRQRLADPRARCARALALIRARAPGLEVDGEMHADAALVEAIRDRAVPDSRLTGTANLLVMPTLDAANIALQPAEGRGRRRCRSGRCCWACPSRSMCVVPSVTARGIVNLSALAALEAQALDAAPAGGAAQGRCRRRRPPGR